MATTTAFTNVAKLNLLKGNLDFDVVSPATPFKMALIKDSPTGTYGATTTSYDTLATGSSPNDEASVGGGGTGYTAGGKKFVQTACTADSPETIAYVDADNIVWTLSGASATLQASACLLYADNASSVTSPYPWTVSNMAVSTHNFGSSPTASGDGATFTLTMPDPTASPNAAIIRLA